MDIVAALRHKDQLPLQLQRVEDAAAVMWRLSSIAADEIERLRAERDSLKADAERYRWLRDVAPKGIGAMADVRRLARPRVRAAACGD